MSTVTATNLKLLQTIDQPLNCDAVESCLNNEGERLVACGMYQLVDGEGLQALQQTRVGSVVLFRFNPSSNRLEEIKRTQCAGVFDMKWIDNPQNASNLFLGVACSDGTLTLLDDSLSLVSRIPVASDAFCLAVDWSDRNTVVSTSTGQIHMVDIETELVTMSWAAHSYSHDASPAEIWTVAWGKQSCSNMIASGADEGCLKIWDTRSERALLQVRKSAHNDCGICSAQFDPHRDLSLITGGYDGYAKQWDVRSLKMPLKTSKERLGGGVWRVKAAANGGLLAAAMRGGFRLLAGEEWSTLACYTEAEEDHWEALAYGVAWITEQTFGGCSFYDRKLRLFSIDV